MAARAADAKGATDVVVLEVGDVLVVADEFVIASASNDRLVKALVDDVERAVGEAGFGAPLRVEGLDDRHWVLIDYGDVVVHVFVAETRQYYELERLWSDVPRVAWDEAAAAAPRAPEPDRPRHDGGGRVAPGRGGDGRPPRPHQRVAALHRRCRDDAASLARARRVGTDRLDRSRRLLADPAASDAWYAVELTATAAGHRDLAGALIVYRLAGSLAELVVGTVEGQRRAVPLGPGGTALRFGDAARLDEMSVTAPSVAVLSDDPDSGRPGAVTVSAAALRQVAVGSLVDVFGPVADAVRARAPFGLRGIWGTLADHVAEVAVRRARDRGATSRPPGRRRRACSTTWSPANPTPGPAPAARWRRRPTGRRPSWPRGRAA